MQNFLTFLQGHQNVSPALILQGHFSAGKVVATRGLDLMQNNMACCLFLLKGSGRSDVSFPWVYPLGRTHSPNLWLLHVYFTLFSLLPVIKGKLIFNFWQGLYHHAILKVMVFPIPHIFVCSIKFPEIVSIQRVFTIVLTFLYKIVI